jgi:hypothetical protein
MMALALGALLIACTARAAESNIITSSVRGVVLTTAGFCQGYLSGCGPGEAILDLGNAPFGKNVQPILARCKAGGLLYVRELNSAAFTCRIDRIDGYDLVLLEKFPVVTNLVTISVRPFRHLAFTRTAISPHERAWLKPLVALRIEHFDPVLAKQEWKIQAGGNTWYVLAESFTVKDQFDDDVPHAKSVIFRRFRNGLQQVGEFGGSLVDVADVTGNGRPAIEVSDDLMQTNSYLRLLPSPLELMRFENPND